MHLAQLNIARARAAQSLLQEMKYREQAERERLADLVASYAAGHLTRSLMMTSAELRGLVQGGMTIGGHTVSHPILSTLGVEKATREIVQGRIDLESIIDQDVISFAYPNGRADTDFQEKDTAIVKSVGFSLAVTTHWGVSDRRTDRYLIPRFTPWDNTPFRFLARMGAMYRNAVS